MRDINKITLDSIDYGSKRMINEYYTQLNEQTYVFDLFAGVKEIKPKK